MHIRIPGGLRGGKISFHLHPFHIDGQNGYPDAQPKGFYDVYLALMGSFTVDI